MTEGRTNPILQDPSGRDQGSNKPVYLCMSILNISKKIIYEFWCDYIKPKYQDRAKLWYVDTGRLVIHIKTENFLIDISYDVEKQSDTSNYDEDECNSIDKIPLPTGKNKTVFGLFKNELGRKIMKEFVGLRAKT